MSNIIPYGRQHITDEDIQAVIETLKSDYLTQGPKIDEFEGVFAQYVGAKYAVAVSNGTAGLHLSVLALQLEKGDKVITTPITFAASANCVQYCGGEVVFADIDPETYLLDIRSVRKLLEASPKGTYKGIIPVDFAGRPVNLEAYRKLAEEYDLWIIEDACHAPGGYYQGKEGKVQFCGDGQYADLAVFSFHPVKHIACGEGGMITTNDKFLYDRLLQLRTHGIAKNPSLFQNPVELSGGIDDYPNWYMEMQILGFNYRITDFQAALGLSQLKRADEGLSKRRAIAEKYTKAFEDFEHIKGMSGKIEGHAYHLFVVEVENRLGLYNYLRQNDIYAQVHYVPTHLMPYYKNRGWNEGDLPNAEVYYKKCLSLPMFPTLTNKEQEKVIEKVKLFYNG